LGGINGIKDFKYSIDKGTHYPQVRVKPDARITFNNFSDLGNTGSSWNMESPENSIKKVLESEEIHIYDKTGKYLVSGASGTFGLGRVAESGSSTDALKRLGFKN